MQALKVEFSKDLHGRQGLYRILVWEKFNPVSYKKNPQAT